MSKILPFSNDEESCECPNCNLIDHFTKILLNADYDEYRDIIKICVHQAKELGQIQYIINELEEKEMHLDYLINGEDDNLN